MAGAWKRIRPHQQIYLLIHAILVLAGVLITTLATEVAFAIGTGITATGITGWVIFLYVRLSDEDVQQRKELAKLGIVRGFAGRSTSIRAEYEPRFYAAREAIDFLGFGHRALREDLLKSFPKFLPNCRIRMLMMDPDVKLGKNSSFARQRDLEENNNDGQIRWDVLNFLRDSVDIKNQFPDRFDIRLYTCFPTINICRIDEEMFWGPYLVKAQSRNMPTIIVDSKGSIYRALLAHYNEIWGSNHLSRDAFRKVDGNSYQHVLNG